ncbi:MAG TPA: tetratricopeptide repeat protein [Elusimicrobiota bacterium]|jgi:tetratricopeptide (TPR) repeat protein|nr:tetratricopeptide repeat protein [Elusimicrobiota bacterium]
MNITASALVLLLAFAAPPARAAAPELPGLALPPAALRRQAAALRRQGASLMRLGLYREAAEPYRKAAALGGDDPALLEDLMWALWRADDRAGAIDAASRVLEKKKDDLEALNLLASAQLAAGLYADAMKSFLASDALKPGQPNVEEALATLYEKDRDYPEALKRCEAGLADRPDSPARAAQRGRLLFLLGRYDEAASAWARALELTPGDFDDAFQLARSRYFSGRHEEAARAVAGLLKDDPHRNAALEFLTDIAVVNDRRDWAIPALERVLQDGRPDDELRMLALAKLYGEQDLPDQDLSTLDRVIALDPSGGAALRDRAEFLETHGRPARAAADDKRLLGLNPSSPLEWRELAENLSTAGRTRAALRAIARARELNPTDPSLLLAQSRMLNDDGQEEAGRALLESWLRDNSGDETVLPVLLYHGLAERDDDPMLASPVHSTTAAFRAQMKALRDAGFTAVTSAQAAAWFHGKGALPARPVLIALDDARLDGFRPADPILKEFGLKATMFAPLSNVEPGLPGFATWDELKAFQATGRWEIEAHGDLGHTYIRKDAQGRLARFLTNRMWLPGEGRLETAREWERRVAEDDESSKSKIREHLGETPVAFAYPEGEYGQMEAPNVLGSAPLGLRLCAASYEVCFQQDGPGLNVRSMDPARAVRVEPGRDWTGDRLVRHIRDESPYVLVRRALLRQLAWDGKTREAEALLEANRRDGVSEPVLLADEARIRYAAGDRAAALRLAQRALQLAPGAENEQLVAEMRREEPPLEWRPEFVYENDSQGRNNRVFRQTLGPWSALDLDEAVHFHGSYTEPGAPTVSDDGAGFALSRDVSLNQNASVRLEGHFLGAGAPDTFTIMGTLRSRWTDALETVAEIGHEPYMYARALMAGVRERLVSGSGVWGDPDALQVSGRLKLGSLTDGNDRYTGEAEAARPVPGIPGLKGVVQFAMDGIRFVSPNYYSPLHLRTYSAGLDYTGKPLPWLSASARYLPGLAEEGGVSTGFSQELDAYASAARGAFSVRPSISYTRTPSYRSTSYGIGLGWTF